MRGKGLHHILLPPACTDHPRLCGEKEQRAKDGKLYYWITPAYAGKSLQPARSSQLRRDHPRLCGEKDLTKDTLHWYKGSPPPMRGKGTQQTQNGGDWGITPAYAGKSSS